MDADDAAAAKALAARRAQRNSEAAVAGTVLSLGPDGTLSTSIPIEAAKREESLRTALWKIRKEQPGLVARQVHTELLKLGEEWAGTTVGEVRRMCNKLAKVENDTNTYRANNHAGSMAHLLNEPKTKEELLREMAQDPSQRDAEVVKEVQPALSRQHTLQRGDHLGSAAERGDTQQVLKLLKKGVDPNYQNAASHVTPLGVASEHGHVSVVQALIDARANVELATKKGIRPIHAAAQFGKHKVMEVLIKSGKCDVNATSNVTPGKPGLFPLLYATNFNHVETLAVLLENGADAAMRAPGGQTALHYAFSVEAVCRLIAARANPDDCNNTAGNTPLHSAAKNGYRDVCLALLVCGAHPGWSNKRGVTPIELAIQTGGAASLCCAQSMLGFNVKARLIKQRHEQLVRRHAPLLGDGELDGVLEDIDKEVARGINPSLYADVATSVAKTDENADKDLVTLMELGSSVDGESKGVKELTMKEEPKEEVEEVAAAVDLVDIDDEEPETKGTAAEGADSAKEKKEGDGNMAGAEVKGAEEGGPSEAAEAILRASGDDMTANLLLCHGRLWRWLRKLGGIAAELPAADEWSVEAAEKEAKLVKGAPIAYYAHLMCRVHCLPKKNLEKAGKMTLNKMFSGAQQMNEMERVAALE